MMFALRQRLSLLCFEFVLVMVMTARLSFAVNQASVIETLRQKPPNDEHFQGSLKFDPCDRNLADRVDGRKLEWERPSDPSCPKPCPQCVPEKCVLPHCKCSNFTIPGKIPRAETPQIVILSIQNAVTNQSYSGFLDLLDGIKNPDGCPATGTFFVSHPNTDHSMVQGLQAKGHEIADNTVVSTLNTSDFWKNADSDTWKNQMKDQASILKKFANASNIRGFRAPYLQPGGDAQMKAMTDSEVVNKTSLVYDSSMISVKYSKRSKNNTTVLWPYTFDFSSIQDCIQPPCPRSCYRGVWEFPVLAFWDKNNTPCSVLDSCAADNYNDVFRLLYDRLKAHYDDNRAPLLITIGPQFLSYDFKVKGMKRFLQYLASYKEVYIVSAGQTLDWISFPTPLSNISSFQPWRCDKPNPPACEESKIVTCHYDEQRKLVRQGPYKYTLRSCIMPDCPKCYPWVGDPNGECDKQEETDYEA